MQRLRARGLPTAASLAKTLANTTPDLPSGVTGVVRIAGLASAATVIKLLS